MPFWCFEFGAMGMPDAYSSASDFSFHHYRGGRKKGELIKSGVLK